MSRETERIRRILILDTETTGLDPKTNQCIEVACTLYDVRNAEPIASFASLIHSGDNAAEAINRIPVEMLAMAPPDERVWPYVQKLAERSEAIVAHRAEFDRGFVPEALRNVRPWICSKFDIEWPKGKLGDHLVHLALAHGVPVFTAHRAMADVDTLVRLFQKVAADGHDVPAMLARAMRPKTLMVSLAPYEEKDVVKSHGFSWNDLVPKQWARRMPFEDVAKLPFRVREASL